MAIVANLRHNLMTTLMRSVVISVAVRDAKSKKKLIRTHSRWSCDFLCQCKWGQLLCNTRVIVQAKWRMAVHEMPIELFWSHLTYRYKKIKKKYIYIYLYREIKKAKILYTYIIYIHVYELWIHVEHTRNYICKYAL